MLAKRISLLILLILLVTGCASMPDQVNMMDVTGRPMPTPHYVVGDARGYGINVVFFYSLLSGTRDLDGTVQPNIRYVKMHGDYVFRKRDFYDVVLTLQVHNPKRIKYSLWERTAVRTQSGDDVDRGGRIAISDLPYREFAFHLPFTEENIDAVNHGIAMISDAGETLMYFGSFKYQVKE